MNLKIAIHGEGAEYYWEQVCGVNIDSSLRSVAEFSPNDIAIRVERCNIDCSDVDLRVVIFDVADEFSFRRAKEIQVMHNNCDVVAAAWHESIVESSNGKTRWVVTPCMFTNGHNAVVLHWAEDSWKPLIDKLRAKYPTLWSAEFEEVVLDYLDHMYWG